MVNTITDTSYLYTKVEQIRKFTIDNESQISHYCQRKNLQISKREIPE